MSLIPLVLVPSCGKIRYSQIHQNPKAGVQQRYQSILSFVWSGGLRVMQRVLVTLTGLASLQLLVNLPASTREELPGEMRTKNLHLQGQV